jgi:hypothetical protein
MLSTQSNFFRQLMLEKCEERIAQGQKILREKNLTIKIAPYHLYDDRFCGSFAVFDANNNAKIESQGPMVAIENLGLFQKEDYDKLYQYGVYGQLIHSVAPDQLDAYSRKQYCLF